MDSRKDNPAVADYLAPDMAEIARQRGGQQVDLSAQPARGQTMTRFFAKRLLPACLVTPTLLLLALLFGQHRGWYELETCLILFVFSVTISFAAIVCVNLRRLSKMDEVRAYAEEQLKIARDAAEAANRFKSAFFANISHEIRTPLTAINGFAELLLNPKRTSEERLADARIIRRNGEHLLTLINDILDLSKIEAGKMSVERILCCPAAVVGEVGSMLQHRAGEKGLSLNVKFEGNIPSTVQTDPTRLRQILINLISNAIKFTKKGGVTVTVSMSTPMSVKDPVIQIKIADTGIGIPSAQMAALFQPFMQGDASIARQYGGTGLGLAISRHFSRALGGDIAVTSKQGKGSVFTVTIETGSLVGVAVQDKPEEVQLQDNFGGPQVRMSGSVLLAEDGIDNQALIATRLRQSGLSVELAPNGQIACEKALAAMQLQQPFDLILMDVQMPLLDGYSATLQLRGKGYRGPIIALTANAMERDRQKCLQAGCNDFVTKPIQMQSLFKALGRYLPQSQADDESAADAALREKQLHEFYENLPAALAEIDSAIEREDRVRVKELLQLTLGKAATAGLKDHAVDAARLLQSAETESDWPSLRSAVSDFARSTQSQSQRQAA